MDGSGPAMTVTRWRYPAPKRCSTRRRRAGASSTRALAVHGRGQIGRVVEAARHQRDAGARYQLAQEHDPAVPGAFHVEPQVDLGEVHVKGDGEAAHARVAELE